MLLCTSALLLVVSDLGFCQDEASLDDQWEQWKIKHGRHYNEEEYRRAIWEENKLKIEAHNQEAEQGKHSYRMGMNFFGDMTSKEMAEKMTYHGEHPSNVRFDTEEKVDNGTFLPKSIDYRKRGMVTRVKNQGNCESCWAFSAAGALEGQLAKKTGQLLDLSVQNLIDCVTESDGCDGGLMTDAFEYVQDNGLNSEEVYPYAGKKQRCRYNRSAIAAQCKGFNRTQKWNESALAKALYEVGPVSVAINSSFKFMYYDSGVFYNPECDKDYVDHAMLLVGYGETAEGLKYWIVKNSYGESWGEEGYFRIVRDHGNHCGIASDASYPLM
ncbi:cathepsin K-like [Scomber scombrus]|uniref:cathepsin K-like n=1 Tax=Scomber scombrus TaxID=13677 RepID=UPI002DD99A91|nr:cathepsin K-like [Scomber scombrus]